MGDSRETWEGFQQEVGLKDQQEAILHRVPTRAKTRFECVRVDREDSRLPGHMVGMLKKKMVTEVRSDEGGPQS